MATIAAAPFIMRDCTITVASDDYTAAISGVTFTPSASVVNWKGLTPTAVFSFSTRATWTAELTYAQDWTSTTSLSKYLLANEGTSVTATFDPIAGGATITATLLITPGVIGGQIDSVAVATVSLGVSGKPVLGV